MSKHSHTNPSVTPRCGTLVMLVFEDAKVLDIACGLGASERLRRAFLRRLGGNPRDYRSRFESTANTPQHSRSKY